MKIVKLLIAFIVILAAAIGAIFLTKTKDPYQGEGEYNDYYKEALQKIESEWSEGAEWSWEKFKKTGDYLEVRKNKFSGGYHTLLDEFHNRALSALYANSIAELAKSDCSRNKIGIYNKDFKAFIKNTPKLDKVQQSQTLKNIFSIYYRAYNLATKSDFSIAHNYNKESGSWASYADHEKKQITERENILKSSYYRYIKNITQIKNGLNSLESKLAVSKDIFKNQLANAIVLAYENDIPADPGIIHKSDNNFEEIKVAYNNAEITYRKLRTTRDNYSYEFNANQDINNQTSRFVKALDIMKDRINKAETR